MTFKVKVNDTLFLYQPREPQDAYLVQIWWLSFNPLTTDHFVKSHFMVSETPFNWMVVCFMVLCIVS